MLKKSHLLEVVKYSEFLTVYCVYCRFLSPTLETEVKISCICLLASEL
jgi:hypothetical protein